MYPIKIKSNKKNEVVKDMYLDIYDDSKRFFCSLKSPIHFIKYLSKCFHF